MLAVWLQNLDPILFHIGAWGLHWYGLSYVIAGLLAYFLYHRLATRGYTDIPPAKVADFITIIGFCGVLLGGRIGWILFYGMFQDHSRDPWYWFIQVWKGGMASHGGIIGVALVAYIVSRRWKVSWISIGDSLCVVATVGIFVVRCANFVNGELYGHETTAPWGVQFAAEIREDPELALRAGVDPAALADPARTEAAISQFLEQARHDPALTQRLREVLPVRHPSQLYEGLLEGAALFIILWLVRTKLRVPRGTLTGLFFILYPVARIIGEEYRIPDPTWHMGRLSAGQFLSLFMFAIGAAFLAYARKTKHYERADWPAAQKP